ncbi:MAG TPA: winged helix-turn-helix transcriptional regulator [Acidimicrobiales bacterium]|jgi:DNA-binding HxlR family transcriptional regulator/putative sterol carrier protein
MAEHRYQQYCALARALDVVGDRWTLLVIRELVPGPRRFTDLVDGLPGVSRALLANRLRELEAQGLVDRVDLPPPAARQVYELTHDGHELASALQPLVAWGARRMGDREPTDAFRPRWAAVGMWLLGDRAAAEGVSETYQFVVGDSAFYFTVDQGEIRPFDGRADHPAVTFTTDEDTWADIVGGRLTATTAAAGGTLEIVGDRRAAKRLRSIFSRTVMLTSARDRADTVPR